MKNKQFKKIYHAAIYVRLSKEDGDVAGASKAESNSISNQRELIRDLHLQALIGSFPIRLRCKGRHERRRVVLNGG